MDSGPKKHRIDQKSPHALVLFLQTCVMDHTQPGPSVTVRPLFAPRACEMSYVSFSLHVNYVATWEERKQAVRCRRCVDVGAGEKRQVKNRR